MRAHWLVGTLVLPLIGCGFPAPYQTYSPGGAPVAIAPTKPLIVYGATTTTPDMVPDPVEPVPAPAAFAAPTATPVAGTDVVAICYNRLWNNSDAIRSAAMQACGTNRSPRVTHQQNVDIEACPLLTPTKAVFTCGAKQ
ncbi:MAG TPA: hypothetical protein VGH13_16285 [Xanthobacteraceae bacterium]